VLGLTPYPKDYAAAMRQAEAHRAAREYGAAVDAYQLAAELEPESPLPWLRAGEILLLQRRFVPAALAYFRAQRLGAGQEALLGLGESYAGEGNWSAAMETWVDALELAPGDAGLYVALGRASVAQSQFDQARRFLTQALESEPSDTEAATAHALLGRLAAGGDPVQAASHFRQASDEDMLAVLGAIAAEPDPARRELLLGMAALQRSELSLARHYFERAVALAPTSAEAHAYLAHTLDQMGETVAAGELLDQARSLDQDSALVYYFLGTHHRLVGNVEAAQAALWQALARDPENAAMRVEMAKTFVDLHDYSSAEEWYQGAAEAAPDDVNFYMMLVRFYLDHFYRVSEGGLPAAQALVALAPDDARAHDLLGWAHHLAGQHAEGERALLQALRLDPDLTSAHYHLGSLYLTVGQRESARSHLQRVIDLDLHGFYRDRAELLLAE
jgi:Flp pilus assembly protein TadD